MKRILSMALLGASFLIPSPANAQSVRVEHARVGIRVGDARVGVRVDRGRVVPAGTARLASCRAPARGRAYVCRTASNVVYRYSGGVRRPVVRDWIAVEWDRRLRMYPAPVHRRDGLISQPVLRDMLGAGTVRRIRDRGHRFGLRGPVRGLWHESRLHGATLTLLMEGHEVAELVDWNRDGLVDQVLLRDLIVR